MEKESRLAIMNSLAWHSGSMDILVTRKCLMGQVCRRKVVTTETLHAVGEDPLQHPLCPVCALHVCILCTRQFRLSDQLFVCFSGHTKDWPLLKQRLFYWIVDAIALAYESQNVTCPTVVQAHVCHVGHMWSYVQWPYELPKTHLPSFTAWTSL